jgi:poly-gamma-glutamate capsule biosynthesis protein CapA/YwtB (metallophosphatase superfamily)
MTVVVYDPCVKVSGLIQTVPPGQAFASTYSHMPQESAPQESFQSIDWPSTDAPNWALFRAEGLPLKEAALSGLSYARKYIQKNWTAPPAMESHFELQKEWFQYFRDLDGEERQPALKAAFVGDLMWIRDSWDSFVSPGVLQHLNDHELVMGNLETPITANAKVPGFLPDAVNFNAPPELLTSFQREDGSNTFTALSFANNHTYDQGLEGARDTINFLKEQGIHSSGVTEPGQKRFSSFEKGGVKFGFYGATWGLNDPALEREAGMQLNLLKGLTPVRVGEQPSDQVDLDEIASVLESMQAEGVEQKVIALHWGHEFEMFPTNAQMNVARKIVALGADVILGSHSHVVQPSEILFVDGYEKKLEGDHPTVTGEMLVSSDQGKPRKALVIYSPGNFTTNMFTTQCQLGAIQGIEYHRDAETGELDWDDPNLELVVNERGGIFTPRRLSLLQDVDLGAGPQGEVERLLRHIS